MTFSCFPCGCRAASNECSGVAGNVESDAVVAVLPPPTLLVSASRKVTGRLTVRLRAAGLSKEQSASLHSEFSSRDVEEASPRLRF